MKNSSQFLHQISVSKDRKNITIYKTRIFSPKPPSNVFKITFAGGLIPPLLNPYRSTQYNVNGARSVIVELLYPKKTLFSENVLSRYALYLIKCPSR